MERQRLFASLPFEPRSARLRGAPRLPPRLPPHLTRHRQDDTVQRQREWPANENRIALRGSLGLRSLHAEGSARVAGIEALFISRQGHANATAARCM